MSVANVHGERLTELAKYIIGDAVTVGPLIFGPTVKNTQNLFITIERGKPQMLSY